MKSGSRLNRTSRRRAVVLLGAGMLACPKAAHANTTYTWSGGNAGTGYWDVASNWGGAQLNTSSPSDLVFGSINQHSPNQPYIEFNYNISSITFNTSAVAYAMGTSNNNTVAVGAGGITDAAANAESLSMGLVLSTSQTWNVGNSLGSLTLNGSLTNNSSSTLTKTGNGTLNLALSGTSGISALALQAGTTQISSGTLTAAATTLNGISLSNSALLTVKGGAIVNATSSTQYDIVVDGNSQVTVSGSGSQLNTPTGGSQLELGSVSTGNMTVTGGATVNTNQPFLGPNTGSTGNLDVTGTGSTFNASGTMTVSGLNGTTGGSATVDVLSGGVLNANKIEFSFNQGTIYVNGGTINTGSLISFSNGYGLVALTNPSSGFALNINALSGTQTYSGSITGTGTLNKSGGSTQILSGLLACGAVTVNGGTLQLNLANSTSNAIDNMGVYSSTLLMTSGSLSAASNNSTALFVSNGTFNISGGAVFSSESGPYVGTIIDAGGSVLVTGSGSKLNGVNGSYSAEILVGLSTGQATLTATNQGTVSSGAYLLVGGFNAGMSGTVLISAGGSVVAPVTSLGYNPGATGTATVTGTNSILTAATALELGGDNGRVNLYGGTGILTITSGGTVNAAGGTTFYSSTSSINISGGTFNTEGLNSNASGNGSIILGDPSSGYALNLNGTSGSYTYSGAISGTGTFNKSGGSTQNLTGSLNTTGALLAASGVLNLKLSGTNTLSTLQLNDNATHVSSGTLTLSSSTTNAIALTNFALLNISGGAIVTGNSTAADDIIVDGVSSILVTGAGTQLRCTLPTNRLDIGDNSTGSMTVSNGASVTVQQPVLGRNTGSNGSLLITGAGSTFNATGTMIVSGYNGTTGGTGTVTVNSGGVLNANVIEFFFNAGTINVNGGTVNTGSLYSWNTGYGSIALTDPTGGIALNINGSSGSQTYSGSISGSGSINKSGGSTQILSGTDTFTGSVLVSGGELDFSQNNQFTHLNISNGATVRFNPGGTLPGATPINLDNGIYIYNGGTNSLSNAITLTSKGGTIGITNAATTLTEITALTGTGPLTVTGPGTLSLAQAGNSYGSLNVSNGKLATINLPTLSSLNLDGGTLAYSGTSTSLASPINITANGGTFNVFPITITLTTTGAFNASNAMLSKTGTGTLDLALPGSYSVDTLSLGAGTLQVSSGTLSVTSIVANPVIAVSNGSALVVSSGATVGASQEGLVGAQIDGNSSATVTGTTSLLNMPYEMNVGFTTPGTLTVSNGGSVDSGEYLEIGGPYAGSSSGTGTVTISSGGTVTSINTELGYRPGSTGTVTVTGSGSTLNATNLLLGGNGSNGGSGVLNITSGGTVNALNTSLSSNTSTINISGGTLNTGYLNSDNPGNGAIILNNSAGVYALNINASTGTNLYSGIISGTGSLNKSGGSIQTLSGNNTCTGPVLVTGGTLTLSGTNQFATANITGGTLSLGTTGNLSTGANVTVHTGGTFAFSSQNNEATPIGAVNLSGGTLLTSTNGIALFLNQIVVSAAGGALNDTTSTGSTIIFPTGAGAGITVTANSTWTVANSAIFSSVFVSSVPINISSGVTLNNAWGLEGFNVYNILGGGTFYQNANPQMYIEGSINVTQATYRVTDVSSLNADSNPFGNLPDISNGHTLTLNGGTFSYGGGTARTQVPINITASGGTIDVESATATLTDTGGIITSGTVFKTGPGKLIVPVFSTTNLTINSGTLELSGSGGVMKLSTLTLAAQTTLDLGADAADISSGSLAAVNLLAQQGYSNGTWTGTGLTSSNASSDTMHLSAVGAIQNNQGGNAIYNSSHQFLSTTPGASDILVAYTYYGDTNVSGTIDGSDYSRVDVGYGADRGANHFADTGWFNGDFNYDGTVDGSDYTLMDNAFNTQTAVLDASIAAQIESTAAVPEPATIALLGIGSLAVLSRRRIKKG